MNEPLDTVRQNLRSCGLRVTESRVAVFRLLSQSDRPLTHQDVVEALSGHAWNRSTLYRNLVDLADHDLARRTVIAGLTRFELRDRANSCSEHPHFVCDACGDVSHLEGVTVNVHGTSMPMSVAGGRFEVQLRGVCDTCDS